MSIRQQARSWGAAALAALLLAACGGGGSPPVGVVSTAPPSATVPQAPDAPAATGDTALDGYNWINYRRAQTGLSMLTRNSLIDAAAQSHASYLRLNNVVSHTETTGQPGFTGADLGARLAAANYTLVRPYAYGEVISATTSTSGAYQAEQLITAIYHRFVMFEPIFKEAGTGAAGNSSGYTYFTADLVASGGYGPGLGSGNMVNYPINNQANVQTNFMSDSESPDPVPGQNEVGYPISVHADNTASITVQSFSVAPRGGTALAVRLLSHAVDADTPASGAAIVPLSPLSGATTYDVSFSGQVNGKTVTRNWSFTTK